MTNKGIPDIIIHMGARTFYVETKATGSECTPIQIEFHKRLRKAGIDVYVLDTKITDIYDLYKVCYTEYESRHFYRNPFRGTKK